MELTLPPTPGWSAMPLLGAGWAFVGAVAKCVVEWTAQGTRRAAQPRPIRQADEMDATGQYILAEAEMALLKTTADYHFRGVGTESGAATGRIDRADLRVNGVVRVSFLRLVTSPPVVDPHNLFGFEPRLDRHPVVTVPPGTPQLASIWPLVFRATRRSDGYATTGLPLPQTMAIAVTTRRGSTDTTVLAASLALPQVSLRAWLYEGGPDRDAYWCAKAAVPMVADTLILSATGAEVLWRAALPLADCPLAALRRLSIEEVA